MKVKCSMCPREHDLSNTEPTFALPDCIAAMSPEERVGKGVVISKDVCGINSERRGFIRVLLPIPVHGEGSCNWGVWVEPLPYAVFLEIVDKWTDPSLLQLQRPARLANELQTYTATIGLPGLVSFSDLKQVGKFELLHELERQSMHALVIDQRDGVPLARKLEWLLLALHPQEPRSA